MTNKEAIKILKNMILEDKRVYGDKPKQRNEALDLAIKALGEIGQIKTLFDEANDADDLYHELRVLFERADNEM